VRRARAVAEHDRGKSKKVANYNVHATLVAECTCHIRSKRETKGYESLVDHLKSLTTQKYSLRVDGPI
jgi:hypothetical protein